MIFLAILNAVVLCVSCCPDSFIVSSEGSHQADENISVILLVTKVLLFL